jgi:hypothetical protein
MEASQLDIEHIDSNSNSNHMTLSWNNVSAYAESEYGLFKRFRKILQKNPIPNQNERGDRQKKQILKNGMFFSYFRVRSHTEYGGSNASENREFSKLF